MSKSNPDKTIGFDIGKNVEVGQLVNFGWDVDNIERLVITKIYSIKFDKSTMWVTCDVKPCK